MNPVQLILVSDPQASNGPAVRKQLRAVLQSLNWMPTWQELMAGDPALPKKYQALSGPFLLANDKLIELGESEEMARTLQRLQGKARKWDWLRMPLATSSAVPGILLAFFPKCAGCWAAYFSVLGTLGIGLPYLPWMRHVLAATLVLSAIYFARVARRRKRWIPFGFQMAGFVSVLAAQYLLGLQALIWLGVTLVFIGSLLYAMPDSWMRKLERELNFAATFKPIIL